MVPTHPRLRRSSAPCKPSDVFLLTHLETRVQTLYGHRGTHSPLLTCLCLINTCSLTVTTTHPDPPKGTVSPIHRLTHKQPWSPHIHTMPHAHLQYALKTLSWGCPANSLWGSEEESDPSVDRSSAGPHTAPQPPLSLQSAPAPHPVPQNIHSRGLGKKKTDFKHLLGIS